MEYDNSGRDDRRYGNTGPGTILNIVSAVGVILGFLLLVNRLYWRWKKGTPGLDDILIMVAWVSTISRVYGLANDNNQIFLLVLGIVSLKAVDFGYGRKQATLTRTEASDAERVSLFLVYFTSTLLLVQLSHQSKTMLICPPTSALLHLPNLLQTNHQHLQTLHPNPLPPRLRHQRLVRTPY